MISSVSSPFSGIAKQLKCSDVVANKKRVWCKNDGNHTTSSADFSNTWSMTPDETATKTKTKMLLLLIIVIIKMSRTKGKYYILKL